MSKDGVLQVGVLIGNFSTKHPMEVLRGLYAGAEGNNVNITLFSGAQGGIFTYWDIEKEKGKEKKNDLVLAEYDYQYNTLNDYALLASMDVLIVAYGTISMYLNQKERDIFFEKYGDLPIIVIQEYDEARKINYIIANNYEGLKSIVDHLIEVHDYKKIVYLSGPHMNTDSIERLRGYMDSMWSHGRTVEPQMIAYGDYSQNVDYLVERLLDENPGADAIVCANDEMAICAYKVCKARGFTIGKDIAVTGFDDVELASDLNPPLTTARQDGFALGHMAMELAMKGVNNKENHLHMLEIPFVQRGSCGCDYISEADTANVNGLIRGLKDNIGKAYVESVAHAITVSSLNATHSKESETLFNRFVTSLLKLLIKVRRVEINAYSSVSLREEFSENLVMNLAQNTGMDIKWRVFTGYLHILVEEENERDRDYERSMFRHKLKDVMHQYIESLLIQENTMQNELQVKRYWDAPTVIRLLKELARDWNSFFKFAMAQAREQGAKSAYIFLTNNPVHHYKEDEFRCPDQMYLVASYDGTTINVYPEKQGRMVTREEGFSKFYMDGAGRKYDVFLLFGEEEQYGVMICEIEPENIASMHGVSMQISSALTHMQMLRREDSTKQELYETLKVLREKNKILNSVSSNDPMTGIYNRRGFTEKALEIIRLNDREKGVMFFADLDHLKEINDVFGHNEGDYALMQIADAVSEMVGVRGCCGRIGGDEFIAMIPCSTTEARDKVDQLKRGLEAVNNTSGKPYYIECSCGFIGFTCSEDVSLEELISSADSIMYEQKKNRRASIRRDV